MNTNNKLKATLLGAAISISIILVLIKAVRLVIPVLGAALVGFLGLTVKEYLARKTVDKIEEKEEKIKCQKL